MNGNGGHRRTSRGQGFPPCRPQWLADAHSELKAAVAAAYSWPADIADDDALRELIALNRDRG